MPILEKLHEKYKPMGFTMVGVNVEPGFEACSRVAQGHACHLSDTVRHQE
ncbi:MAG: hypothetical protein WDO12_15235 [Pseudomonadota bacterium]